MGFTGMVSNTSVDGQKVVCVDEVKAASDWGWEKLDSGDVEKGNEKGKWSGRLLRDLRNP